MNLLDNETRSAAGTARTPAQGGFRDQMPALAGQDVPLPKRPPTRVRVDWRARPD